MAKRFTDTGKWAKEHFCSLSLKLKMVWIYLCDNCDHAGIWDVNFPLMSFQIGTKVSAKDLNELGERIEWREESKIFLPSFITFQYGTLNPENRVHQSILNKLQNLAPYKPHASPLQGAKDKEEDKEEDKEIVLKGDARGKQYLPRLADLWNQFCHSLPKVKGTNSERNKLAAIRLAESDEAEWTQALEKIEKSEFCRGNNDKGWVATFDWILQPAVRLKVLEGTYDNREKTKLTVQRDYSFLKD